MRNFVDWVMNEVHWQDLYPSAFIEFRKKYSKLMKQGLYVQFTDFANDALMRTPWHTPNHTDPSGIYAYPLKYIINYPADIWYGSGAKYLRVLSKKADALVLSSLNEGTAKWLLSKMGIHSSNFDYAMKFYKYKGVTKEGKAFMAAVQFKLEEEPVDRVHPMRTGEEQRQLFLKAGIKAIEDRSTRNTQAIINSREPEQIVFFTRDAFEVVEVINLRTRRKGYSLDAHHPDEHDARKLVSMILDAIDGDKIIAYKTDIGKMFWSRKGRQITVSFDKPQSYYDNKKLGEKKHKESKLHDAHLVKVEIEQSEKGSFSYTSKRDETFKQIVQAIKNKWQNREEIEGFTPATRAGHEAKVKAAEEKYYKELQEKKLKEKQESFKEYFPKLKELANKLGVRFDPKLDVDYVEIFGTMQNMAVKGNISHDKTKNKELLKAFWEDQENKYEEIKDSLDPEELKYFIYSLLYFPKNMENYRDLEQLKEVFNKMHSTISGLNFRSGEAVISHALRDLQTKD